ncbi:MAG: glycosyltransferase family 4 protein [Bacteroidales bacterium]|nr:glycosyltransferase family 4 protein [Bacteroidales bacterium]MCF8386542.1 glycosyltransferase family 4 protein [Bacteroidales bacterium]MCF8398605.1 glycosyltransferase family 4 protein [Bacteroidales bacterium]
MRILFVLEYYYPHIGGVEKLFKMLCEELVENGHDVTVLTNRYDSKLKKREVLKGVKIRRLSFYNRYLFTFFSLPYAVYYAGKAELIHTTSYNAAVPAYLAARMRGKKIFITFHEAWGKLWFKLPFIGRFSRKLFYYYEKFILGFSFHKFIAVSEFTKDSLVSSGVKPGRVLRIYNGVDYADASNYKHSEPSNFTFTYFGRLGPSKGLDLLIPAAMDFLAEHPDASMKLIIPREKNDILRFVKQSIEGSQIEEQVNFLHELSKEELYREIANSSCVVIPSYSEGFCFAAAETIALGVPIISSAQGALKEVVSGKYLEMERMDHKALKKCLIKANAHEWDQKPVKKFGLQDCIHDYLKVYRPGLRLRSD